MLKLYKKWPKHVSYWEAWDAGDGTITVHWGSLGKRGRTRSVDIPRRGVADDVIEAESTERREDGYEEVDVEDHEDLVVQHRTAHAWGDGDDLEIRHRVEDILNETLGWTGNGHCDGGDIGSGTTNAYAFVVDAQLALKDIVAALRKNDLLEGATIAVSRDDDYVVLWPEDHVGEFSIF